MVLITPVAVLNDDQSEDSMTTTTTYDQVLNSIMSGKPATDVLPQLQGLSSVERRALLGTLRSIHDEIASTCREHGEEVSILLDLAGQR
jgi:hypothetical protein